MTFKWPWQYNFPPFFTIQPNIQTREKQLEAWSSLVLDYCQKYSIYSLDLTEAVQSELFYNENINRRLCLADIQLVLNFLDSQGHIEWKDKAKYKCKIYWRKPDEWGDIIYNWAKSIGLINTVTTFYEITQGEDSASESFAGLDSEILLKSLQSLESQNRAVIVDTDKESGGVKFI